MNLATDLLAFAYFAQCRCDPARTMEYFTYLSNIVKVMEGLSSCPQSLQDIVVSEQSRNRFTLEELQQATNILGFGTNGPLKVEYDSDIDDDFVENAWKDCIKRGWRNYERGSEIQREANEAFRIIAEARGSVRLWDMWEARKEIFLTPERAYDRLEIPKDVDDAMLITVFSLRVRSAVSVYGLR